MTPTLWSDPATAFIYTIDAAGAKTFTWFKGFGPTWAPDGSNRFFYAWLEDPQGPSLSLATISPWGVQRVAPIQPWAPWANPQPVTVTGYTGSLMEPFLSRDGSLLFFNSNTPGSTPAGTRMLYWATRVSDAEFAFGGEIAGANPGTFQVSASMDAAGDFYFSTNSGMAGEQLAIWRGPWMSGGAQIVGSVPVLGLARGPGYYVMDGEISADGSLFVFSDNTLVPPAPLTSTLAMATKNADGSFTRLPNSDAIMASINGFGAVSYAPTLSDDRLTLVFTRIVSGAPGLFMATRIDPAAPFGVPEIIAAAQGFVEGPCLSRDGHRLYFHQQKPDGTFGIIMLIR